MWVAIVLLSEQNHCYLATVVPLPDNADDPLWCSGLEEGLACLPLCLDQ